MGARATRSAAPPRTNAAATTASRDDFQTFGGIQITQPLLRGFGFGGNASLLGVRIAKADRAISDWQYRQTVIDTITNVVVAYSNLDLAHQYLSAAQRSRDGAAALVVENEKRFKVGSISDNDVTSARARTALRDQGVLVAEQAVRDADNQLRLLLGESAFSNDGPLLAIDSPPPPEIDIRPAEDLKKAYELRPDFQQARFSLEQEPLQRILRPQPAAAGGGFCRQLRLHRARPGFRRQPAHGLRPGEPGLFRRLAGHACP